MKKKVNGKDNCIFRVAKEITNTSVRVHKCYHRPIGQTIPAAGEQDPY